MSAGTIQDSFVHTNVRTPLGPTNASVIQDSRWQVMAGTVMVKELDISNYT